MRLDLQLRPSRWGQNPAGALQWDSETGALGGSLAPIIAESGRQAAERGWIAIGPQLQYRQPCKEPLREPAAMAALLRYLEYELPSELIPYLKTDFPGPLEEATPDERERTLF